MKKISSGLIKKITLELSSDEENCLSPYAAKSKNAIYDSNKKTLFGNFSDDVDLIINSKAYTRYMGKTQVFSHVMNDQITTRAVHVQLVSKISRKIGKALHLNLDLIEAISLGHDLGHTPYGHEGEKVLNDIMKKKNKYFRHGAQSMRILRDILNLDISIQVLDGILCHNGEKIFKSYKPNMNKTKEDVLREYYENFNSAKISSRMIPMTLEGCVVRLCDIIAYIGRDLEDAILLKVIERKDLPREVVDILGNNATDIVESLVTDVVENSYDKGELSFSDEVSHAMSKLKDFNMSRIYSNAIVKADSIKRQKMIEIMFEKYMNDYNMKIKTSPFLKFLQTNSKKYIESNTLEEMVADFIAGMTDDYLKREYTEYLMPTNGLNYQK